MNKMTKTTDARFHLRGTPSPLAGLVRPMVAVVAPIAVALIGLLP